MRTTGWVDSTSQDLRYAVRSLKGSPGFTAVAILTLALGVAATTAIFSTVNATLLRPLPYTHSYELVDVRTRLVDGRVTTGLVSAAELAVLRKLPLVVRAGGYQAPFEASLVRDDGTPVSVVLSGALDGFFDVLGLPMTAGRTFNADELGPSGRDAPFSLVISHPAWVRLFDADPAIVGKAVRFAELRVTTTVVGVAAPLIDLPRNVDFWFNARSNPTDIAHNFNVVARLRPGATIDQLRIDGNAAMKELAKTTPSADGREWVMKGLVASLVGDLGPVLLIALGATGLLLALACVNVTNLLLARGVGRTREMALRAALGAERGRIIRQLLTEAMVLAAGGAILGFALATVAVRVLLALGGSTLPRLDAVPIDTRLLLFSAGVLTVSGLIMGMMPAWRLSRADVRTLLNESTRSTSSGLATSRVMSSLIVAEIALAIALVAGAGWLVQSFARLQAIDPGFEAEGRLVVDVRSTRSFAGPEAASAYGDDMLSRIRAAAPEALVGASGTVPLRGDPVNALNVELQGEVVNPNKMRGAQVRFVSPGYLEALGVKLIAGRWLTDADRQTTEHVALVDRAFARQYYPDRDPLTGAFYYGYPQVNRNNLTRIVGVIDDVRFKALAQPGESTYYLPAAQVGFPLQRAAVVIAQPGTSGESLIEPLRDALTRFDPQLVVKFTPLETIVSKTTQRQEMGMTMMLVFGAMAVLLAGIGIYGVIAYAVDQRRTELATRIALGAPRGHVFRMLLGTGVRLGLTGVLIGVAAAYAGGRVVASSLYAMQASDPLVLIGAGAIVAMVTVAATMIPALIASRINPVRALRAE
jgi:putative ABC transport system permease protein